MIRKVIAASLTGSLLVAAFLVAPASVKAAAATYYVGPGADTGGSCTTPDYTTDGVDDDEAIQDAVDAAVGNAGVDTIVICDGVYDITAMIDLTADTEGLIIQGETSAELSVVDGASSFQFIDTDFSLTIRDLTVRNFENAGNGGAIHNDTFDGDGADVLTIEDSVFTGNVADGTGGAIYWHGQVIIENSTLAENTAPNSNGGAIYIGEDATIGYSTFEDNFAENYGGAIYSDFVINLDHSDFISNSSWARGGAVASENSVYTLYSTFTGNGTVSQGGAIYAYDDASTGFSVFTDNTSGYRGGAIATVNVFNDSGLGTSETHIYNSTFSGNIVDTGADGKGGAVFGEDECTVTGSNFTENTVSATNYAEGGALYCDEDIDLLSDNRFSGNQAISEESDGLGGAVYGADDFGWSSDSSGGSGVFRNTFTNNFASADGGAILIDDDIASQFTKNVFKGNRADQNGGALYVEEELQDDASFNSNRFEGNIASDGDGGGAYFESELMTGSEFKGNRFARNRAGDLGGALRVDVSANSDPLNLSRNTFVLNRAAIGGAVGGGAAASRGDARVLQRALRGNRLVNNKATQQRRTFNVGIEIAEVL